MSRIHFIGIGGIGTSALARYYLLKGEKVTGSDLENSQLIEDLRNLGASIVTGSHTAHMIRGLGHKPDFIVHSPAIQKENKEYKEAKRQKIPTYTYPEALGELTKVHHTIAVSGTHGKSTTTAMIGLILTAAGLDPTVIVGTKVKEFGNTNCRMGESTYLVIEADEYAASFLNYYPTCTVLTNIEADHLDFYKNLSAILSAFRTYISHIKRDGLIIANAQDDNIKELLKGSKRKVLWYGPSRRKDITKLKSILRVPGSHTVSNALAALMVARTLQIPDKKTYAALGKFQGTWRRFETFPATLDKKQITVVSDYGHHPTEVDVTLRAVREKYAKKRIHVVFQPHQFQRTFLLFDDFVDVLSRVPVDSLIIPDIYNVAGREKGAILKKVSSKKLVDHIKSKHPKKNIIYLPKRSVLSHMKNTIKRGDVLVIMGAGDIFQIAESLKKS